jgi:hypothetical protein
MVPVNRIPPDCLPDEEWREIPDAPGYIVSSMGRVASYLKQGRYGGTMNEPRILRTPPMIAGGYLQVTVKAGGRYRKCKVHTLVLTTFVGPRPEGMECRHLNSDPMDNRLSNLKWSTHKDNMADKIGAGTHSFGADRPLAKLRDEHIPEIIRLSADGTPNVAIAERFGVSVTAIWHVVAGMTWKHVPRPTVTPSDTYVDSIGRTRPRVVRRHVPATP